MTVEVGDSVSLLCRVEGSPTPQVTWSRRDGKPVTGWQGPGGVSSQLEAAELLIHSKRTESALAWWAVCVGVPPVCILTPCHPWVLPPSLLQVDVPAVGLAPMFALFTIINNGYNGFICTFYLHKLSCAGTACKPVGSLLHQRR